MKSSTSLGQRPGNYSSNLDDQVEVKAALDRSKAKLEAAREAFADMGLLEELKEEVLP